MAISIPGARRGAIDICRGVSSVLSPQPQIQAFNPSLLLVRHAQHKQQGSVNGTKDGAGRRLGSKKGSEEYVIPGQIIFRQRGTTWHAGENVGLGKDHTIFALQPGFVKYYRNPTLHPKKRYIGVALRREQTLPTPLHVPRVRRLGMVAIPRTAHKEFAKTEENEEPLQTEIPITHIPPILSSAGSIRAESTTGLRLTDDEVRNLKRGKDGAYRQESWEIGRAAERAGVQGPPRDSSFEERSRYKSKLRNAAARRKSVAKVELREARGKKKGSKRKR